MTTRGNRETVLIEISSPLVRGFWYNERERWSLRWMGESTVGNGPWKRGEQYGWDGTIGTAPTLFNLTVLDRMYYISCGVLSKEYVW